MPGGDPKPANVPSKASSFFQAEQRALFISDLNVRLLEGTLRYNQTPDSCARPSDSRTTTVPVNVQNDQMKRFTNRFPQVSLDFLLA